ncbi:MAG: hypothetical protein ACI89W_000675 [Gammaproteobacteria bacterium]|jgi:hypothetical protein
MKSLTLYNTESIDELVWPDENLSIPKNKRALSIVTDFRYNLPRVIGANVSLHDLSEENVLKKVNKCARRDELVVSDFMHSRESLKFFNYKDLVNASVNDVLETQRNNHQ